MVALGVLEERGVDWKVGKQTSKAGWGVSQKILGDRGGSSRPSQLQLDTSGLEKRH